MATSENPSEVSEFYLACLNGNVDSVKEYLLRLSTSEWNPNDLESSVSSTPLHAASCQGHKEIVRCIIQHGCDRSQIDGKGLTAYQVAVNDDIRQLFKRSTNNSRIHRFQDENTDDSFDFVKRPKQNNAKANINIDQSESKTIKTQSVQGYRTKTEKQLEIGYTTTSIAICQSKFGRFIADRLHRDSPMPFKTMGNRLQQIIDREINENKDPQSFKANQLLKKFLNDYDHGDIQHLIRLYTLETNFYDALKQNPIPLALSLYIKLETLKERYFKGQSYRGAKLDDDDIQTYQRTANHRRSLLQTRHFSSTSLKRSVAEQFLNFDNQKEKNIRRNSVLFIFNFPDACDQAINLTRISDKNGCLSEFEDEDEILILPWTLFQVDRVTTESPELYTIYLTNILLPHNSMLSSFKWILKHPKSSINHFHEHFPQKQPEIVVKQLASMPFRYHSLTS